MTDQEIRKKLRTEEDVRFFHNAVYTFYNQQRRQFPWRNTYQPYHILVSEIMLQQTQTERVQDKYEKFVDAFPDVSALARADLALVLSLWQGLGYNRRALNLKKTAEMIINDFDGKIPETQEGLIMLPGIGKATAGAILAFAFNKPSVFIETNIRRVFIHCFFQDKEGIADKEIMPLVEQTLDRENPRHWYYALMDYGAMLSKCVPNPNRKSAHYTRQARFEGSDRQIRGLIVKTLVNNGSMEGKELIARIEKEPARVKKILYDLECDGLIVREYDMFRLA